MPTACKRNELTSAGLRLLAIFALLGGLALPSLGQAAEPARGPAPPLAVGTPVVFVAFDELPTISLENGRGEIDAGRFPNFAAFARASTWFENATTVADGTRAAQPVLISGRNPVVGGIPAYTSYRVNLFTLLGPTHDVHAVEPITRMCPPVFCGVRPPRLFGRTRGQIGESFVDRIAAAKREALTTSPFAEFIDGLQPQRSARPPLYYIHVLLPHHPWRWLPDGRSYGISVPEVPGSHGVSVWDRRPDLVRQGWQRHLLQLGYTDRLLGRLIVKLKAIGLYDRSLIVLGADHGISFLAGASRRAISKQTAAAIAPVPVFIKAPGQQTGRRIEAHVETPDVLPTLADILDLRLPRAVTGHSALDPGFVASPQVRVHFTSFGSGARYVMVPWRAFNAQRRQLLRRQAHLFGSGAWGPRFFGTEGPMTLVGHTARQARRRLRRVSVIFDNPPSRPTAAYSPTHVSGMLPGARSARSVAIAVNDRIVALTPTYEFHGTRFSALLPETAFRGPRVRISVYTLRTA